tara:strand:- start:77 stop:454 length:378 start_codon:yes stop_codon:yes gene_type:complete
MNELKDLSIFRCSKCDGNTITTRCSRGLSSTCFYFCNDDSCRNLIATFDGSLLSNDFQDGGGKNEELNNRLVLMILDKLKCSNVKCKNSVLNYKKYKNNHYIYYCDEEHGGCGCMIDVGPSLLED